MPILVHLYYAIIFSIYFWQNKMVVVVVVQSLLIFGPSVS